MCSTISWISAGGGGVIFDTTKATKKLINAPTAPKEPGLMPRIQCAASSGAKAVLWKKKKPLYQKMYSNVLNRPANIPAMAPLLFIRRLKMPIIRAGKIEEAASPKAKATT